MVKIYISRLEFDSRKIRRVRRLQSDGARLLLQAALSAEYHDVKLPAAVEKDEHGKPYLKDRPDIHISLSHSGHTAACVTAPAAAGVDIQEWRDIRAPLEDKLHPDEKRLLVSVPESLRRETFFHIWTRKESFMKADGRGLGIKLSDFCTVSENELRAGLLSTNETVKVTQSLNPGVFYVRQYPLSGNLSLAACSTDRVFPDRVCEMPPISLT